MIALYYLARLDLERDRAERAVLLISIFPFAFFFGMIYSESTYLLFTVLAFLWFRMRWWIPAGIAASIAIATRTPALMMWPSLAWIAWRTAQPTGRDRAMALVALVLAVSGFAWYSFYIYQESGNPFEWAATLQRWNYKVGGAPWRAPIDLVWTLVTHPYAFIAGTRMCRRRAAILTPRCNCWSPTSIRATTSAGSRSAGFSTAVSGSAIR